MLDTIHIGMSGLEGHARGLRVIANNTANMNTPGFKSARLQFFDRFDNAGNLQGGPAGRTPEARGLGLDTGRTQLSLAQGELRQTGQSTDLALEGQGMFVLRDAQGQLSYARAGQFAFDAEGRLVDRASQDAVMGLDDQGRYQPLALSGRRVDAGAATTRVQLAGNLSSTAAVQVVDDIEVFDAAGRTQRLSLRFTNDSASETGAWWVDCLDGETLVGRGRLVFADGAVSAESKTFAITFAPAGAAAQALQFEFGPDVVSFAAGNLSTLAVRSHDGVGPGALVASEFDTDGTLQLRYANGRTQAAGRLAVARPASPESMVADGANRFRAADSQPWDIGTPGQGGFGALRAGALELSNVDLSQEFSELVIMQRGYQASSQVISTANDMLQELFSMSRR